MVLMKSCPPRLTGRAASLNGVDHRFSTRSSSRQRHKFEFLQKFNGEFDPPITLQPVPLPATRALRYGHRQCGIGQGHLTSSSLKGRNDGSNSFHANQLECAGLKGQVIARPWWHGLGPVGAIVGRPCGCAETACGGVVADQVAEALLTLTLPQREWCQCLSSKWVCSQSMPHPTSRAGCRR